MLTLNTSLLIAYPTEIWPYSMRARGLVATVLTTQLAVFFNVFVNPIALHAIAWKYYIVFAVFLVVITLTIYVYYPETRGHTLEEIAVVFDGPVTTISRELQTTHCVGQRDASAQQAPANVHEQIARRS